MATQIAEFFAKITAETSGLQKGLADASKSLDGMAKQTKASGGAVQTLSGQLAGLINPTNLAMAAVTGLGLYLVKSTKAAAESAQVDAKLGAVLRATGIAAGMSEVAAGRN